MIINDYISWLKYNRNFSQYTIWNYRRSLVLLDEYIKKVSLWIRTIEDVEKINILDLDGFVRSERLKGKDVRTCNWYLAWIKVFLRYCLILWKDVLDYRTVIYWREVKKKIESLTEEECKSLIDYFRKRKADTPQREIIKTRDLLIAQLLLYTGLRVSELSHLKVEDVGEVMQIIGKGGRRRPINLFREDLKLIDLYLYMRKEESERLLISHSGNSRGKRLSTVSIENIIREGAKNAWISGKVFPHKLRHTFATNLLRGKANIFHIQQLLGHNSVHTTQNYITVLNSECRETQENLRRY